MLETTLAAPVYFVSAPSSVDAFVEIRNQAWSQPTVTIYANPVGEAQRRRVSRR
jgi:hypothetical protein